MPSTLTTVLTSTVYFGCTCKGAKLLGAQCKGANLYILRIIALPLCCFWWWGIHFYLLIDYPNIATLSLIQLQKHREYREQSQGRSVKHKSYILWMSIKMLCLLWPVTWRAFPHNMTNKETIEIHWGNWVTKWKHNKKKQTTLDLS